MPTNSPWPKCQHMFCQDDALGHCTKCSMDACADHMTAWHKHDKDKKNLAV